MKSFLFSLVALALCGACSQNTGVTSPDGTIRLAFAVDSAGRMTYSVTDGGVRLFEPSRLGFEAAEADLGGGFAVEHVSRTSVDETWTQPWGENKENRSRYNEMAVRLRNGGGVRLTLRFRLFDDGLGFRYEYEASGADSLRVTDELTEFRFAADGDSWTIPASFDTYELLYRKLPLSELADANTPATFKVGGLYGSIHEAALYDFPEMTLRKTYGLAFKSDLAPLPDGTKAHVGNKFTTAWRTVQLAPDAVGLINSSLILNLNEPSKIGDTSWIRPMKYVGVWWGMHLGVETWAMDDRHGATTENAKRHIDFAAANNIQGVLFEGWNEGWEDWFGKSKDYVFDFVTPYPDFDVKMLNAYAKEKGVKLMMHHETSASVRNYERHLDTAYQFMADNGYNAVKSGYVGNIIPRGEHHYGQWMNNHYLYAVTKAADYKICVNAHEAVRPTGLCRTYPNLIGNESARGTEYEAFAGNKPFHTTLLPFTRLIGGPMDYTPGIFDTRISFLEGDHSVVRTTLAKQLALYVTMYSPLQMAADLPESYERHPDAFQFIKDVALDWDDSKYLEAEPGDYITVARKAKGTNNWFVGGITDENARTAAFTLDFLEPGKQYVATLYADGKDADYEKNPTSYQIKKGIVTNKTKISAQLARSGGFALSLIEASPSDRKSIKKWK